MFIQRISLFLILFSFILSQAACNENYATYSGGEVSQKEIDELAKDQIEQLQNQIGYIKKQAAFQILFKKLIEKEAGKDGIEKYFASYVNAQKKEIPEDWAKIYASLNMKGNGDTVMNSARNEIASRNMRLYRDLLYLDLIKKYKVQFSEKPSFNKTAKKVPTDGLPYIGNANAPITVVAFTDFQCPYCKRAFFTVGEILSKYKKQIKYVYADFPLQFHKLGKPAAYSARCAGEQNKFWQYHDALFLIKKIESRQDLNRIARTIGLDMGKFQQCVESGKYKATVDQFILTGQKLGVSGTPAFFINGKLLSGAVPISEFIDKLQSEGLNP